jgi:hypothetical protein
MLKIEVLNEPAEEFESTWEGQTRKRVRQWCVITIKGRPSSFQVTVDPGKEYAPGDYELAPESFSFNNGRLSVQRVVLAPLASAMGATKPQAAKVA